MGDANGTIPAPLPTPRSIAVASSDNPSVSLKRAYEPKLTHRAWRAESSATEPITEHQSYSHKRDSRPRLYAGLPPDPKQWNTDELTTYLETSFRTGNSTDGAKDDPSLVDILECVRTRGFTGRELLRLTDADLVGYVALSSLRGLSHSLPLHLHSTPLSVVQRAQLLEHSRVLRADVLRGRIYVDSEVSDNSNGIDSRSARSSTPFYSIRGASVSADNLRLLLDNNSGEGESVPPPSPAMSLKRSNSVSDASAKRYRDLARMRMRRRGRVKGLVETWERASTSGSECSTNEEESVSGSEAQSESEIDEEPEPTPDSKGSPESPSDLPSALCDELLHDVRSSVVDSAIVPQEPPLCTPPPPYTHMYTALGVVGDEEEEPSIEELLASSSSIPLRGARAWEADFGLGETVKRIPVSTSADAGSGSRVVEPDTSPRPQDDGQQTRGNPVRSKGSGTRRSTGSRGKNAKSRKRVVTAIFTGSPSDDVSEDAGNEMHLEGHHRHTSGVNRIVRDVAPASSDLQNDPDGALRALEESIAVTRAQLETFRLRLEEVEVDTARQEAMLMRGHFSNSRHSSEFELSQRRSEASEQATAETTEPLNDGAFVEGARSRDVLEGLETMPLADVTRAIVARAMGWLFPYGHLGLHAPEDDGSRGRTGSRPGTNDRYRSPAKKDGRLPVARMSCSIFLVSFAICAAVLRRMGFGRWVR